MQRVVQLLIELLTILMTFTAYVLFKQNFIYLFIHWFFLSRIYRVPSLARTVTGTRTTEVNKYLHIKVSVVFFVIHRDKDTSFNSPFSSHKDLSTTFDIVLGLAI